MISGQSVLDALERQEVKGTTPINRLAINSVRIRAETLPGTASFSAKFPAASVGGLLRNVDRLILNDQIGRAELDPKSRTLAELNYNIFQYLLAQNDKTVPLDEARTNLLNAYLDKILSDANRVISAKYEPGILGAYRVTLSATGALSGQVQYYGRTASFAGRLTNIDQSETQSECVVHLDPKRKVPLRLRIQFTRTAEAGGRLSVVVCALAGSDPDLNKQAEINNLTMATGSTELSAPEMSTFSTVSLDQPKWNDSNIEGMNGSGYLTVRLLRSSGRCILIGRLPDNRSIAAVCNPTQEGGRTVLPVHFHELTSQNLALRSLFADQALDQWPLINYSFRLVGGLEIRPGGDGKARDSMNPRQLYWYNAPPTKRSSSFSTEVNAFLSATMAPWTPPGANNILAPFLLSGGTGSIQVGSFAASTFKLAKSNTATLFPSNPLSFTLRFNPSDGTFAGTFFDKSGTSQVRRSFQGVCVNGGSAYMQMAGFSLDPVSSKPVVITAPTP
jgi:hypothetical protein